MIVWQQSPHVTPRHDLSSDPLPNIDLVLFVDGSAHRNEHGSPTVGYAVANKNDVQESAGLPSYLSAQAAELFALTRACILAEGQTVTIYMDSRYAFGVVHDLGTLWKNGGFLTSTGSPIKHHMLVSNLLEVILLSSALTVCKCSALLLPFFLCLKSLRNLL